MSLRFRHGLFACALAAVGCALGSESGQDEQTGVAQADQSLVLSENANCKVEITKVEYNQPGTDVGDYIELKVTKKQTTGISTLLDCGIGSLATYNDASLLCAPSSTVALATVVIPADGYIEIGQNQSTVAVTPLLPGPDGWLNNTRGEIALLNTALPSAQPLAWLQWGGAAKCNLLSAPLTQVQPEGDTAPNYTNVSCDNTFHLVLSTNAVQRTNADCPSSGGAGGAGGSGGGGGSGGLSGSLNQAGANDEAGASGEAGAIGEGGAGNAGGKPGAAGSGNTGNVGNTGNSGGEAGEQPVTPSAGRAGSSNNMVAEGGGCSCSVPSASSHRGTQALALLGVGLGLALRRRRARSH